MSTPEEFTYTYTQETSLLLPEGTGLPPISNDDNGTIFEDEVFYGNVLSNDSDPDGEPIIVTSVNGNPDAVGRAIFLASGAIVFVDQDGSYFYDPHDKFDALNDGESASDSFTYTIDNDNLSFSALNVSSINAGRINKSTLTINGRTFDSKTATLPPVAVTDNFTVRKNEPAVGNLLTNDRNPEGGHIRIVAVNDNPRLVDQEFISPKGARVEINANGLFSYFPNSSFNTLLEGQSVTEIFTYTISNDAKLTASSSVDVTIQGFNDLPAGFDPAQYGASNPDLIRAYKDDLTGLTNHYLQHGRAENRPIDNFDELRYIASNRDLINPFGLNGAGATLHYLSAGFFENRATTAFDPARYLNSYDDLRNAFVTDLPGATKHFITDGFREGRNPNLFPSDRYIASNRDLLTAFRYNLEEGSRHYLFSGRTEGRQITFDPLAYISRNPDLANLSPEQATFHYITAGFNEGRAIS